ncbi:MAG: hypothetical protein ACFFAJ_13975 [Candidatus Hodarchaeota archaeon]
MNYREITPSTFSEQIFSFFLQLFSHYENGDIEDFKELWTFFNKLYQGGYNNSIGFPDLLPIQLTDEEHRSKNKELNKALGKVRKPIIDFLYFLYTASLQGEVSDNTLVIPTNTYLKFMKTQKRIKLKILDYVGQLGLHIEHKESSTVIKADENNKLIPSLTQFAKISEKTGKLNHYYFRRCDLRIINSGYNFEVDEIFLRLFTESEYANYEKIHSFLCTSGFKCGLRLDNDTSLEITYTNKKIKSTPLFVLTYDVIYLNTVRMTVKFAAMNRITSISHMAPIPVQELLFNTARSCSECGFCKKNAKGVKGLVKSSVLKFLGQEKVVCWYNQSTYHAINEESCGEILGFMKLHQNLILT